MLTPSDDAHLQAAEGSENARLSMDLDLVQQRLFAMGAAWRSHLPEAGRLTTFAKDLLPHPVVLDTTQVTTDLDELGADVEFPDTVPQGESDMKWRVSTSIHSLTAGAVAILVVGLLAATFAFFSHHSTGEVSVTATSTPTPAPPKSWVAVASLSSTNSFALAVPAIAPSDPRIVYKVTDSPHLALQRTDDGGATWQTLQLPVENASQYMQLYVSPLNPNVVVLHTDGWVAQQSLFCNYQADAWIGTPANRAPIGPLASMSSEVPTGPFLPCSQFLSTNGGRSWTQSSTFFDSARLLSAQGGPSGLFMVQDNRLYTYAGFSCQSDYTGICGGGLLVSLDGGMTWSPAPTPSPGSFCGIGMAPSGSVMFAITSSQCGQANDPSDNTIWRSDDAGAHWAPVSHLQFSGVDDIRVVINTGAAYPTVYLTSSNLANAKTPEITRTTQVQESQDGGKTWSAVPTKGIPTGWSAMDVVAQASDGSAIAIFGPGGNGGVELYSWRPGGTSWQPVALTPGTSGALYLVTSSQATPGAATLWAVTVAESGSVSTTYGGGVPYTSMVYRLQL
jgi:photosystem II stability/assembly factor-like uncharacterized protein